MEPWIQTYSGRQFWPLSPKPSQVHLADIAQGLSMKCRYNGQALQFYSVAEHSVLLSRHFADTALAKWALFHDAAEAYLPDVPRPIKQHLTGFALIETNVMHAICKKFDLPIDEPFEVKRADTAILADEMQRLMAHPPADWYLPEPPLGVEIEGWLPEEARERFLNRFAELFY